MERRERRQSLLEMKSQRIRVPSQKILTPDFQLVVERL